MDLPILRYVDVFIGLALVMLLGCSVVAALTQLITSGFYLRAQYLRQGLADMLQELVPDAGVADCQFAAKLIQRHPMVSRPETSLSSIFTGLFRWVRTKLSGPFSKANRWMPSGSPATVIQRHELLSILLEWAAGEGVLGSNKDLTGMTAQVRNALAANGVHSPSDTLNAARYQLLAQERAYPDRAAHLWHTAACIDACPPALVGKVHSWYDGLSARTTQRFTLQSRWIGTAAAGFLLVFIFPIDSLDLLKRLSMDDKLRSALVAQAEKRIQSGEPHQIEEGKRAIENLNAATLELRTVAAPFEVKREWPYLRQTLGWNHMGGILLSWVLLSLGTPFWYDALKNLLKFRSVLAQKEEQDRKERLRNDDNLAGTATASESVSAGVVAVAAQLVVEDESGDKDQLEAVG